MSALFPKLYQSYECGNWFYIYDMWINHLKCMSGFLFSCVSFPSTRLGICGTLTMRIYLSRYIGLHNVFSVALKYSLYALHSSIFAFTFVSAFSGNLCPLQYLKLSHFRDMFTD